MTLDNRIPADIKATVEKLFEPYSYLADGPDDNDVAALIFAERKRCVALALALQMVRGEGGAAKADWLIKEATVIEAYMRDGDIPAKAE